METSSKSLRIYVLEGIKAFLYEEKFATSEIIPEGILEIVDSLSSYHEEGKELFPEIILTNNINNVLATLPSKTLEIHQAKLSVDAFKKAIKLCAPLAIEGWVVFIEVSDAKIRFGLTTAELSEVSPSLYRQLFSKALKIEIKDTSLCYIKNIGFKTVQLTGSHKRINVSFSLKDISEAQDDKLAELCKSIVSTVNPNLKELAYWFFERLISEANKIGHGTLIGIIKDESIGDFKASMDGTFFEASISLLDFLELSEIENSRSASTNVRQYTSLVKSMINTDGITVFTTKGDLVGYHVFVDLNKVDPQKVVGGARSRAFEAMKLAGRFECCFFKSQDGNEKFWSK